MEPADPFARLGVPAQPWLDAEKLQARYDALARGAHPDAHGASGEFAQLGEAYAVLCDPVQRIRALLELYGELPSARTGTVPEHLVERFMAIGAFLPEVDALLQKRADATTHLAKALLAPGLTSAASRVTAFLAEIDADLASSETALREISAEWPPVEERRGPVFVQLRSILQQFAFLRKWRAELQQRQFSLANG